MALFSGFKKSSPWQGRLCQSQVISERERSYWLCSKWSQHGIAHVAVAPAGGRCLVFPQLISTWLPGHKLSHFTAKQYTTRCFWKHLRREIGITVTEYWFIFDQRCLVWPFDRSLRVIDSWLIDGSWRLQLSSDWLFSSGLWNLADAIRSTGGHWRTQSHMIFFQVTCSCTTVRI